MRNTKKYPIPMTEAAIIPPTDHPPPRPLFSVSRFCDRNPAFPKASMRQKIFEASPRLNAKGETIPGNGLLESGALLRCGRKVLIDETKFYQWLDRQNAINPTLKAA